MNFGELFFAATLVMILLGLGFFFGWKQVQALRRLPGQVSLTPEDRGYQRRQAWLRLFSCTLLLTLGGMVAASYLVGFEDHVRQLGEQRTEALEKDQHKPLDQAEKQFVSLYASYWIIIVALVLAVVLLAVVDRVNTRWFGLRQYRQIQEERRAMIEQEVASVQNHLRSQRNGHG